MIFSSATTRTKVPKTQTTTINGYDFLISQSIEWTKNNRERESIKSNVHQHPEMVFNDGTMVEILITNF